MEVIPEEVAAGLVDLPGAITAVREAFVALDQGRAELFPVALGRGSDPGNGFAAKSGRIDGVALGVKIGSYWPGNVAAGRDAHASTVVLLDDATGFALAVIGASHLTALRTAAVDAVAVDALARADASTLAVVGTGQQAYHDALAIALVRDLGRVIVSGRSIDRAEVLADRLRDAGLPAESAPLAEALPSADIVTTVTSSTEPLVAAQHLAPGVHVSAMGADSPGKHEVALDVVGDAVCVADVVSQSVTIGELQHAAAAGVVSEAEIATLGAVLTGRARGRTDDEQHTVFDSSGTAIQDLAVCSLALRAARDQGK